MLIMVLALIITVILRGLAFTFLAEVQKSLWWVLCCYLQTLDAHMGVGLDGILWLQELDDRALDLVQVTELYRILCFSSFV